jgi:hypothetical protein
VYVVDVDAAAAKAAGMRNIEAVQGQQELVVREQLPQLPTAPPTSATDAAPRDVSTAAGAAGKAAKQGGTITKDSTSTTIGSSGGWAPPQSPVLVPRVKSQHPVVVVGRYGNVGRLLNNVLQHRVGNCTHAPAPTQAAAFHKEHLQVHHSMH